MKYDLNILNDYIAKGLVEKNNHPSLPIAIYNYSRDCQASGAWDEITLSLRGTILDDEGTVVASAFSKFFNYEEVFDRIPIDQEYVYVQDKMDGSLGILFYYADQWHLATKGSFTSDQAIKGMEIINKNYTLESFHKGITYIVEIIYPENRIVVDYQEERVVFLGASAEGVELNWATAKAIFQSSLIPAREVVNTVHYTSFSDELYKELKSRNEANKEGFVLRFYPSNFRMKIKFEEYVRLHGLLTNFSNINIWECLKDGKDLSKLLEKVPDEFDTWVRKITKELIDKFEFEKAKYEKEFWTLIDKKAFAELVENRPDKHFMFRRLTSYSRVYDNMIWDSIRPAYQKPFWNKD